MCVVVVDFDVCCCFCFVVCVVVDVVVLFEDCYFLFGCGCLFGDGEFEEIGVDDEEVY